MEPMEPLSATVYITYYAMLTWSRVLQLHAQLEKVWSCVYPIKCAYAYYK